MGMSQAEIDQYGKSPSEYNDQEMMDDDQMTNFRQSEHAGNAFGALKDDNYSEQQILDGMDGDTTSMMSRGAVSQQTNMVQQRTAIRSGQGLKPGEDPYAEKEGITGPGLSKKQLRAGHKAQQIRTKDGRLVNAVEAEAAEAETAAAAAEEGMQGTERSNPPTVQREDYSVSFVSPGSAHSGASIYERKNAILYEKSILDINETVCPTGHHLTMS